MRQCYLAAPEPDEDPAVYGSGAKKSKNGKDKAANGEGEGEVTEEEEEEEEDSTLLTVQPGFNRLVLVLRDPGVLHFVKYVSAMAAGSRWDVCGEYEVGRVEVESDEGGEEDGEGELESPDEVEEDDDGLKSIITDEEV